MGGTQWESEEQTANRQTRHGKAATGAMGTKGAAKRPQRRIEAVKPAHPQRGKEVQMPAQKSTTAQSRPQWVTERPTGDRDEASSRRRRGLPLSARRPETGTSGHRMQRPGQHGSPGAATPREAAAGYRGRAPVSKKRRQSAAATSEAAAGAGKRHRAQVPQPTHAKKDATGTQEAVVA